MHTPYSGKGCPGREAHWLNTRGLSRYLISIENSRAGTEIGRE
ncbi:hypothetical protein T11_3957 [Trichinella zimbabwensis]|uniref:Uncharacterized protein n=1 Tax=Trichinella zimbabwensis TaxID=268475 RepID=A0A0V1DZI2_9BILA|nr:hypothetical protein T11_3957 [Trichinella zimbabwensis]